MLGLALEVDRDAGVVEGAGGGVELEIADEAGAVAVGAVGGEHGLKPAWSENQVVVEQGEKLTAGDGGAGVIGGGVAEIFALEDDADRGIGREEASQGRVPSVLPSSMKMISWASPAGSVARSDASIACVRARQLKSGMRNETVT